MAVAEVGRVTEIETFYTPDKVDSYLRRWLELTSQAESPSAPSLVSTGAQPGKGGVSDHKRAAVIVADLEKAWITLRIYSLEWNVIDHRMRGRTMEQVARAMHRRTQDICDAYDRATKRMAEALGWVEPEGEE